MGRAKPSLVTISEKTIYEVLSEAGDNLNGQGCG
jgi:hypothetical protein